MAPQVLAAALHFDQHDRLPNQVGEGGAAGVGLLDALLANGPGLLDPLEAERLEKAVQEDLGLALLVADDVLVDPNDELGELLFAGFVHARKPLVVWSASLRKSGVHSRRLKRGIIGIG